MYRNYRSRSQRSWLKMVLKHGLLCEFSIGISETDFIEIYKNM